MNPQDEAISILHNVLQDLTSPNHDLFIIMRRCQHVCEILGWQSGKDWFHQEINGYYPNTPLPPHRKINGIKNWEFEGSMYEEVEFKTEATMNVLDPLIYTEEPDLLEVKVGINWFRGASQTGYKEKLPETKSTLSPSGRNQVLLRRVRNFPAENITHSLSQIEKYVFDWASSNYVQMNYTNKVKGIWERYQIIVEGALQKLELTNHLSVIQDEIGKENPESWRTAVLECRNLLADLATYLWKDTRDLYIHLPGSSPDGKLDVQQGNYSNRLSAYLHQKSIAGKEGKFLRDEADRLATSIRSLISVESYAHAPIDRPLADAVVLYTYFLIGELAIKTDLSPITKYK